MEGQNDLIDMSGGSAEESKRELREVEDIMINKVNDLENININISSPSDENNANKKVSSKKPNENEPLNKKISNSGVIQVPNIEKDNKNSIDNTLNESILTTIYRDLSLISIKLKYVIKPYGSKEKKNYHIKQWDLWGPLLLIIFLACTLAVNSSDKSQTIVLIFLIFWLGSFLVFLNAHLLGVKTSIFQIFCLLGYSLFPLNVSAFILSFTKFFDLARFIIIGIACFWSLYSISSFLKNLSMPEQRYLVLYPSILLYIYISWFIFVTKH